MMMAKRTIPNATAMRQAKRLSAGIVAPTIAAIASPTPVAAKTVPSVASTIGSSAAQPSESSSLRPSLNPCAKGARVILSPIASAMRQAQRPSAIRVACCGVDQQASHASAEIFTGAPITIASSYQRDRERGHEQPGCRGPLGGCAPFTAASASSDSSLGTRRRPRAARTPSAMSPIPMACSGPAHAGRCAASRISIAGEERHRQHGPEDRADRKATHAQIHRRRDEQERHRMNQADAARYA